MALTLLIDLDDTLLQNDIDTFLPAYLKALGKHLVKVVPPDQMIPSLLAATQKMVRNESHGITLEHSFDEAFYPAIGQTKAGLRETLAYFYEAIFPTLQPLTAQKPAAVQLVKQGFRRGHTLVVATNPVFPRRAIEHRLNWAGVPPEEYPFSIITSYEGFHFAKPNPAYLAEILAQLGWPDQGAVMIGNSLEEDMVPAATLGIPGFWVTEKTDPLPADFHPLSAKGSLEDALPWIEKVNSAPFKWEWKTPAGLLAVLKSTPAALDTLAHHLSERQTQQRPEPTEWSITEILCHLRDVDSEVNLPRIEKILAGDVPFIPGVNSDTWADERKYCQQDASTALREWMEVRSHLITKLAVLLPDAWQLTARHAIFGPTTLLELISFNATHDRSHIQQIFKSARQLA